MRVERYVRICRVTAAHFGDRTLRADMDAPFLEERHARELGEIAWPACVDVDVTCSRTAVLNGKSL